MRHIHIMGASGSGATTLGAALAQRLGFTHLDSDDFFWIKTDPAYVTPRPAEERIVLLREALPAGGWVVSGSMLKWGQQLEPLYDLIVYLSLDPALRMERLHKRQVVRHGARILPGGDMAAGSVEFLEWAATYDTAGPETRSRAAHEIWLATRTCPVLRLDSAQPVEALVSAVLDRME